jgi:hypothetical protein
VNRRPWQVQAIDEPGKIHHLDERQHYNIAPFMILRDPDFEEGGDPLLAIEGRQFINPHPEACLSSSLKMPADICDPVVCGERSAPSLMMPER